MLSCTVHRWNVYDHTDRNDSMHGIASNQYMQLVGTVKRQKQTRRHARSIPTHANVSNADTYRCRGASTHT